MQLIMMMQMHYICTWIVDMCCRCRKYSCCSVLVAQIPERACCVVVIPCVALSPIQVYVVIESCLYFLPAFARSYYSSVVTTLENLVELSESVLHTLSTREDTPGAPIPKFVQLCEQLCLTEKVMVCVWAASSACTHVKFCRILWDICSCCRSKMLWGSFSFKMWGCYFARFVCSLQRREGESSPVSCVIAATHQIRQLLLFLQYPFHFSNVPFCLYLCTALQQRNT